MDNLEILLSGIPTGQIEKLIQLLRIRPDKITNMHFYQNNEDIEIFELVNFFECYSIPSTGFVKTDTAFLGVEVNDVIVIISGVNPVVEVTINFKELNEPNSFQQISDWLCSLDVKYEKIIFGYEDEEPIFEISYNEKENKI